MDKKVVKELNAYLMGEYVAVKSYEKFIERTKDSDVRQKLQKAEKLRPICS